jgi:Contractile injection system spike tip protein
MADFILIDGDIVKFNPTFGSATLLISAVATLSGSGKSLIDGKAVCVAGDEENVKVEGVPYMNGPFSIPGTGTLTISALAGNHKATETKSGGKAVLLKGGSFTVRLQVKSPALQPAPPAPPVPDPIPQYTGTGEFITTNVKVKGT